LVYIEHPTNWPTIYSESLPVEPSAASSTTVGAGEEDSSPRASPSSAQQLPKLDSGIEEDEEDDEDYDAEKEDGSEGLTTSTDEDGEDDSAGEEGGEEDEDEEKEEDEVDGEDEEESVDEEDLNGDMGTKAGFDSGATTCMALLFSDRIIVANVGDSRAVLCREGKAVDLSIDHKPEDTEERQRIERAGGIVNEEGRVNGGLNLSRALGDHYKQTEGLLLEEQMITALPDVKVIEGLDTSSGKDQFLVVACDGIWYVWAVVGGYGGWSSRRLFRNSMTSQQVVDFVLECRPTKSLKEIGADLTHHCLADGTEGTDGTGCDNMTVSAYRLIDTSDSTQ
jgi:protein phosphatase 1G